MNFITFNEIKYKNIMSVGNMPITIKLDKTPTTAIIGKNGRGKSTFLEALSFGLFGKPYRDIKIGNLVNNKTARELEVEVTFTRHNDKVIVRRGMKPDLFEISVNGVVLPQDGKKSDYQTKLEESLLGFDYNTFTQIVMIGKSSYVPFMKLKTNDRRKFVEKVLDLEIFSQMAGIHAELAKTNNQFIQEAEYKIGAQKSRVEMRKQMIERLKQTSQQTLDLFKTDLMKQIDKANTRKAQLEEKVKTNKQKLVDFNLKELAEQEKRLQEMYAKIEKLNSQIEFSYKANTKQISFFRDNTECPTCRQHIDEQFRTDNVTKLEEKNASFDGSLVDLAGRKQKASDELNDIKTKRAEAMELFNESKSLDTQIMELSETVNNLTKRLAECKLDDTDVNLEIENLNQDEHDLEQLGYEYNSLLEQRNYDNVVTMLLKDTGIKSTVINEYVPKINKLVNSHMASLGLFAHFRIDDQFNEEIHMRGFEPMIYNQLSEGEKLRVDMAIMMAWRDISRVKSNMSCNLMILDEVWDSSLDNDGVEAFNDLLTQLGDLNVFVITHTPEKLADKFRAFITFDKEQGFTVMKSESGA